MEVQSIHFPAELVQTGAAEVVHDLFQVFLIHYMWLHSVISMPKYMFAPWAETCNWVWILISECCIMLFCHCQLLHRGPPTNWYSFYSGHSCPGVSCCLFARLELGCEPCTMFVVATTFVSVLLLLVFWSSPIGQLVMSGSKHVCYWFEPSRDVGLGKERGMSAGCLFCTVQLHAHSNYSHKNHLRKMSIHFCLLCHVFTPPVLAAGWSADCKEMAAFAGWWSQGCTTC